MIYPKPKRLIGLVQPEQPNESQINEQVYIREGNNIRARTAAAAEGTHIGLASLMCVRHRFRLLIKTGVKGAQGGILIKSRELVRQRGTRRRTVELLFGRPRVHPVCMRMTFSEKISAAFAKD